MKGEQALVPKLRFGEFAKPWKISSLESNFDILAGYAFKSSQMSKVPSSDFQILKMSSVHKGILNLEKNASFWNNLDQKLNKFVLVEDDVLITLTGTVNKRDYGYSIKIKEDNRYLLNQRLARLRGIPSIATSAFSEYLLKTDRFYYLFFSSSKGGTGNQSNVSIEDFKALELPTPSLPEQEKIAAFLTSVDDRIDQLKRKKSLLQDYKKGAMQKLFSQELRFKDQQGKDFPDWEEKKLGEVLKIGSGKDYKHLNKGDIPVYGSGGLMTHVDQFLYEGESVCIGRKGTIDKPQFMSGKFWTVDTLFYTHNFKGVIPRFILSVFQQITWYRHNEAGGVPSLSKKTIENIFIDIPSLPEQTKIANFLSSLDQKLEQIDTQITQTQTFKKGLLQQMFV